jgi:RNA polymerase sigma-70 factor, ECF subfamily
MSTAGAAAATVGRVAVLRQPARTRRLDPESLGRHLDRLFRAAWAMTGNPHDAEDLVQDAVTQVLARPRFLRHGDDIGYLLRVLRNTHVSRLRRAGSRPSEVPIEHRPERDSGTNAGDPAAALEVNELFAAISDLPDPAREVIVAIDVVGLSYRDAAEALGIKEATVTTRLHRARARIAQNMYGDSESVAATG